MQFSVNVIPQKALCRIMLEGCILSIISNVLDISNYFLERSCNTSERLYTWVTDLLVFPVVHFCYAPQISSSLLDGVFKTKHLI